MRQNFFMGGGFFGPRPSLGQASLPDLMQKLREARAAGDEEMARYYEHLIEEWRPRNYTTKIRQGTNFGGYDLKPQPPPPPPPSHPGRSRMRTGNIPQYSRWESNPGQISTFTSPTSQPIAANPSDVHCYYCEGLPEFPTYWMSEAQAAQWNRDRDARCNQVNSVECQKKYNQMQADQQASVRRAGFNAFNLPGSTTYAPTMSGRIPVQNPELIG